MATIKDRAVLQTIFHPNVPFDEDFQEEQGKQQAIQGDDSLSAQGCVCVGGVFTNFRGFYLCKLSGGRRCLQSELTTDSLTCFSQTIFKPVT